MVNRSDCPCNGCVAPKRHEACHDSCKEYKEWVAPIVKQREDRAMTNILKEIRGARVEKFLDNQAMKRKRGRP